MQNPLHNLNKYYMYLKYVLYLTKENSLRVKKFRYYNINVLNYITMYGIVNLKKLIYILYMKISHTSYNHHILMSLLVKKSNSHVPPKAL